MRIVIIPSWYPSEAHPVHGIFVRDQAQCLARRFHVTVLTQRSPSFARQLCLSWGPEFVDERDAAIDVVRVRRLKQLSLRRLFASPGDADFHLNYYRNFGAAMRRGFARLVQRDGPPDLIHAHVVLPAGWIAVELGRQYGIPVVLTEHSGPFAMHLGSETQRRIVRDTLTGADGIRAVSAALRDAMLDFLPGLDIGVLGNIIDTDYFTPGAPQPPTNRPMRFLFVGQLNEQKGVQHLLAAADLLVQQGRTGFELHIGGSGPYRPVLEQLTRDLGLTPQCRFLGELPREATRECMRSCDVLVLPSLGETFGVVLAEAMACGKPVLATRCGGPETVVTPETGVLVAPAQPRELAEALAGFLDKKFTFDPVAIRRSVVERFGADAFLNQAESFYHEVLDRTVSRACSA